MLLITKVKGLLTNFRKEKSPEKSEVDPQLITGLLDEGLKICKKYFFNEIEFEYKKMKVKVKQDGLRMKGLDIIAQNFDKAKELQPEQVNELMATVTEEK